MNALMNPSFPAARFRFSLPALLFFLVLMPGQLLQGSPFAGGNGSEHNPYLVANAQQLDQVRHHLNAHFRQTADIDLNLPPWNAGQGWEPIGPGIFDAFTGVYDGNGHVISGLFINRQANAQGLFGYIIDGGLVKNLGLVDASVQGGDWYVGALAGRVMGARVHACFSTGTVAGSDRQIGGLVGRIEDRNEIPAFVENAYSLCAVSGQDRVGGLVGKVVMGGSRVIHAYSAGPVTGTGSYVGALVGRNGGSSQEPISLYWALETADHDSDSHANPKTTEQMRRFTTFLWWDFKGETLNGAEGIWNIGNGRNNGFPYFARQFPEDPGINAVFSDGSGTAEDPFLISTPDELALISFQYLNNDAVHFALANDIDLGVPPFNEGEGWVPVGTNQNRQVFTPVESSKYFSGHFDGRGHTVANLLINRPNHSYQGLFGQTRGATLENLELSNVSVTGGHRYLGGLVGRAYSTVIRAVGVTGEVRGGGTLFLSPTGTHSGGLAGFVLEGSSVSGCRAQVDVSGWTDTGGLIGTLEDSQLTESWASGWTRSRSSNGGLVARVSGASEIRNTYSRGQASTRDADIYLGGLIGLNDGGSITNSYSTTLVYYERAANPVNKGFSGWVDSGAAARMSGNYWDTESSGQTTSGCNAGGASTAMLTHPHGAEVYTDWNFETIWTVDAESLNDGYPILRFFSPPPASGFTVTYQAGPGGYVSGDSPQTVTAGGNTQPVEAIPEPGAVFGQWSDGEEQNPRTDQNIQNDIHVTAHFHSPAGVPIDWYVQHGFEPHDGQSWADLDSLDSFGKGMTLRQEFLAGTDPRDTSSRFTATVTEMDAAHGLTLRWPSAPGRVYAILHSVDLLNWNDLVDAQGAPVRIAASEEGSFTEAVIELDGLPQETGFFRVTIVVP